MTVQATSFKGDNQQQGNSILFPVGLTALGGASGFAGGYYRGDSATLDQVLAMPEDEFKRRVESMPKGAEKDKGLLKRVFDLYHQYGEGAIDSKVDADEAVKTEKTLVDALKKGLEGEGDYQIIKTGEKEITVEEFWKRMDPILQKLGLEYKITDTHSLNEALTKEQTKLDELEETLKKAKEKYDPEKRPEGEKASDLSAEDKAAKEAFEDAQRAFDKQAVRVKSLKGLLGLVAGKIKLKAETIKGVLTNIYSLRLNNLKDNVMERILKPIREEFLKCEKELSGKMPKIESYRKGGIFAAVGAATGLAIAALLMGGPRLPQGNQST